MNISKALKLCRNQRGFSKTELAKETELSISYLTLLEQGKRDPNLSALEKICSALAVPPSIFMLLATDSAEVEEISPDLAKELALVALQLMDKNE